MNDRVKSGIPGAAESPAATRRLTAILHADVAGYSRLMGADEAGTHARLMAARKLMDHHLEAHGGRVANTAGDAVLAVFDSIVGALSAAIAIQATLAEHNAALPEGHRLVFRVGLTIGDVIVDRGDVFGEGVNVAARIEALAEPGGIAVSAAVREHVGTRLPVRFVDRGMHRLKNIDEPVQVFAVISGTEPVAPPRRRRHRPLALAAAFALAAAVLGVVALFQPRLFGTAELAAPATPATTPRPRAGAELARPVIAVLPFSERGGAVGEGYFADGVTEDVIGALGRFSGLVVLSWNAVAPYRGHAQTLAELGEMLGAGYVVGGSIQRAGGRIRVGVQLSAAADGALIWSSRYDEDLADIFAVQDRITQQVVAALTVRVTQVERARAMTVPTGSLGAYDSVLRGREAFRVVERSRNVEARALFERALELDPNYADAHVELGWTHLSDLKYGWTQWPQRALDAARGAADRAVTLDPHNAPAHALLADALKFLGDMAGAERAIDRALELNPNIALAHSIRASVMLFTARSAEALAAIQTALRLDPYPRAEWLMSLLSGQFLQGSYADVLESYSRYRQEIGGEPTHLMVVAAAHATLGNEAAAKEIAAQVRRSAPFLNAAGLVQLLGTPTEQAALAEGLRRAGLLD